MMGMRMNTIKEQILQNGIRFDKTFDKLQSNSPTIGYHYISLSVCLLAKMMSVGLWTFASPSPRLLLKVVHFSWTSIQLMTWGI